MAQEGREVTLAKESGKVMKKSGRERWFRLLIGSVVMVVALSASAAVLSRWQIRSLLLHTQTLPYAVALVGLWRRNYWAWVMATLVSGYAMLCLVQSFVTWHVYLQSMKGWYEQHPLLCLYMVVFHTGINIAILFLLMITKNGFRSIHAGKDSKSRDGVIIE